MTEAFGFAVIDEPPFCFSTEGGPPTGYDVEVGLAVLRAIGIDDVALKSVTFAELLPGVASGRRRINTPPFRHGRAPASRAVQPWRLGVERRAARRR